MWTRRNFLTPFAAGIGAGVLLARSGFCQRETTFETKLISAGDNYPSLNIRANRLIEICVALHRRKDLALIGRDLGVSPEELRGRIDSLVAEGLVRESLSGQFLPTCMVVTLEDAKWMAPAAGIVEATGRLIADRLPDIRVRAESVPAIRRAGFSLNAFLILSDVLLDNWQIGNVEGEFLKAERPLRNGRRYYYAVFEKPAGQRKEAFGIYGNGGLTLRGIQLCVYGNQRYDGSTLYSLRREQFIRLFDFPPQADLKAEVASLLECMISFARTGEDHLIARQKAGLEELGLFENGVLRVTVFSRAETMELGGVAAIITPALLGLLERNRAGLADVHRRSPYREETTFNEFFMWWYHFFYSAVTNWLAHKGLLDIPPSGNATYLIAD